MQHKSRWYLKILNKLLFHKEFHIKVPTSMQTKLSSDVKKKIKNDDTRQGEYFHPESESYLAVIASHKIADSG